MMASVGGAAAEAAEALFRSWREGPQPPEPAAVDQFCEQVRANGHALPVIYFCEWIDRWLMGNLVPGPDPMHGRRYEVACLVPEQATQWAEQCGDQFPEQQWLASRLREAAAAWDGVADRRVVVVVREPMGASTDDEEVRTALQSVPGWLHTGEDSG